MNILIFSASTGGGHISASNAVKEYFLANDIETTVIDAIEYISPILNKAVTEIYDYVAVKQPKIWKLMYDYANSNTLNKLITTANNSISKKLLPIIEKHKPDAIITTHPFTTEMISKLKESGLIDLPLICIMTDYAPHKTWISSNVNEYIVANETMIESMSKMGVNSEIIHAFGIPVDNSFHNKLDKKKILRELSLDDSLPTILMMAGKGGLANIDKIYYEIQKIDINFQIIIITGKNEKLYYKIKDIYQNNISIKDKLKLSNISKHIPNLKKFKFKLIFKELKKDENIKLKKTKIIYFTKEVKKYMDASDLIITKPGGLTVSEALACGTPMALFNAIPGQEEENANFLINNNMAVKLGKNPNDIIKNLLINPEKLKTMKNSCENFDKSDSLKNILNLIYKVTSKEKIYNKLVRDKIPEIIFNDKNIPKIRKLNNSEFTKYLKLKMIEEAKEFQIANNIENEKEEIADLLEVIYSFCDHSNISINEIEKIRKNKLERNGGFNLKIFLEKVILSKK